MTIMNGLSGTGAIFGAIVLATSTNAAVFDFEGGVPVYDANRSEILPASTGYHYDELLTSKATVGFNWANNYYPESEWNGVVYPASWDYAWNGIAVSNCDDATISTSSYWTAGDKSSYTSKTGTDSSGIKGGTYGIFYGMTDSVNPQTASSEAGTIVFNELVSVQSVDLANTLVTYDQLNSQRDAEGNLIYTYCIDIYGITSDGATLTENYVRLTLADSNSVSSEWQTADLSSLNTDGNGLWGLSFSAYSDWYNSFGLLVPSYCAMDNIAYAAVPEPSDFASLFAILSLIAAVGMRKVKK